MDRKNKVFITLATLALAISAMLSFPYQAQASDKAAFWASYQASTLQALHNAPALPSVIMIHPHTYSAYNASVYADQYALQANTTQYPDFSIEHCLAFHTFCATGADCTNFASQALHAGGFPMIALGQDGNDDHNWWIQRDGNPLNKWGYSFSHAWTESADLYKFLVLHNPGGNGIPVYDGSNPNPNYLSGVNIGDLLFYDWYGHNHGVDYTGSNMEHVSIETVYNGTDHNSNNWIYGNGPWFGSLVDEHTHDGQGRKQVTWTLYPYNPHSSTTYIYGMKIDPNN